MTQSGDQVADRLAALRQRLDVPPGVMTGVLRLPILDPILDELEAALQPGAGVGPGVAKELEALAELLLTGMLGTAQEAIQRRMRVVELLRRMDSGRLPALVADPADAFGEELRAMLASDDGLRAALGTLYPLTSRATSVVPSARWRKEAKAVGTTSGEGDALVGAARRVLAALLRAEVVSRPDVLLGGLRLANQRFARGLLWFAAVALEDPVDLLATVGLRMGTSGRSDAVVRDAALANSAAALLGASTDDGAVAALASMRLEVVNRNVLKQIDRALGEQAARAGVSVDELVDAALPRLGLDDRGAREVEGTAASASIRLGVDGRIAVTWRDAAGAETSDATPAIEAAAPDVVAEVAGTVKRIGSALEAERRRLELRLASERVWSNDVWRRRFIDHPLGRVAATTLIWTVHEGAGRTAGLPADGTLWGSDDREVPVSEKAAVGLWHPCDASATEVAAWRATLAARGVTQAIQQADRDVFRPDARAANASPAADLRHAGAVVDHSVLRAGLRRRGWAVPALGPWDQGDEATAWRAFDDGLRAELRYQAPERVPTGERIERARIVAVRFIRTDAPPASPAATGSTVLIPDVPPRAFSETLRDVSAVVA